jgi:hypothetical protein
LFHVKHCPQFHGAPGAGHASEHWSDQGGRVGTAGTETTDHRWLFHVKQRWRCEGLPAGWPGDGASIRPWVQLAGRGGCRCPLVIVSRETPGCGRSTNRSPSNFQTITAVSVCFAVDTTFVHVILTPTRTHPHQVTATDDARRIRIVSRGTFPVPAVAASLLGTARTRSHATLRQSGWSSPGGAAWVE